MTMTTLLIRMVLMVAAETEVTCDEDQEVACSTAAAVTPSLDDCNSHTACHKSDTPATTSQSDLNDKNDNHPLTTWLVI